MRLLAHIENSDDAREFSHFLTKERIPNRLEPEGAIWIIDEDDVEKAKELFAEFSANPSDKRFRGHAGAVQAERQQRLREQQAANIRVAQKAGVNRRPRFGFLTIGFILICSGIFLTGDIRSKLVEEKVEIVVTSPVYAALLYDFPTTFSLYNELATYKEPLPPQGRSLMREAVRTPYWQGFYPLLLRSFGAPAFQKIDEGPIFEKLREGEAWRLFTPIFLHADIFHILFNMIWLIVLGNQIEYRIGPFRYLLFIAIAALITNTAQYFVSGPAFLGFSGVICAMLGFIWMRQVVAAWEGYHLTRATLIFILIFVLAMFGIQTVSFVMDLLGKNAFPVAIANTAHLVGGAVGILLGRLKLFAISSKI